MLQARDESGVAVGLETERVAGALLALALGHNVEGEEGVVGAGLVGAGELVAVYKILGWLSVVGWGAGIWTDVSMTQYITHT